MSASIYERLRDLLRAEEPVALATVVNGPQPGAKLLVRPEGEPLGALGDPGLDRVVGRDARAQLQAGLTSTRHYGPHGEARQEDGEDEARQESGEDAASRHAVSLADRSAEASDGNASRRDSRRAG